MDKKSVGEKILSARRRMGKTQFKAATDAGVRPETLSRIERGARPSMATLKKLSESLGLSYEKLVKQLEEE